MNDLFSLDPKLFRNLMMVKHYDGDVSELDLNFTVAHDGSLAAFPLRSSRRSFS